MTQKVNIRDILLGNVLDHINFLKIVGNKRVVSDQDCRRLVIHFNRYRCHPVCRPWQFNK